MLLCPEVCWGSQKWYKFLTSCLFSWYYGKACVQYNFQCFTSRCLVSNNCSSREDWTVESLVLTPYRVNLWGISYFTVQAINTKNHNCLWLNKYCCSYCRGRAVNSLKPPYLIFSFQTPFISQYLRFSQSCLSDCNYFPSTPLPSTYK